MLTKANKKPLGTTVNEAEIAKFSAMAEQWWNPEGVMKPLHAMNPVRLNYIIHQMHKAGLHVHGAKLLDVGCGCGLLSEPMARKGAHVTGIDASEKNITMAKLHSKSEGLQIEYRFTTAEETAAREPGAFDVVCAMEIIEHVEDVPGFIAALATLVKPGGLLFISTLNRTPQSYLAAIVGAEYVLKWLPKGTHDWKKFLKPAEIVTEAEKHSLSAASVEGFRFNPLTRTWSASRNLGINYSACFRKP